MKKNILDPIFLVLIFNLFIIQNAYSSSFQSLDCNECQLSYFEQKSIENGCIDTNEVYNSCAPQHDFLKNKMVTSLTEGKSLLVIFGANWCKACRSLDQKLLEIEGDPTFEELISNISIGLSDSNNKKSVSGENSVKWLSIYLNTKIHVQYYPYMLLINPQNKRFTIINHMGKTSIQIRKELLKQHAILLQSRPQLLHQ